MDPRALAFAAVFLGLSAVLSALHLALADLSIFSLSRIADNLAARGTPRGRRRLARTTRILADVPGHARAMGMARVACNLIFAAGTIWTVASARHATPTDAAPEGVFNLADAAIGGAIAIALLWLVSVAVAESVARHAGARAVYNASLLVRLVHVAATPLRAPARWIDRAVRALVGDGQEDLSPIEQELREVVEAGRRGGEFDEQERAMIQAAVGLRSMTIEQLMTPRTEIEALEVSSNLGQVTAFVRKGGHSRVPVYRENLDDIVGIFYVKDLLRWLAGATHAPAANSASRPQGGPRPGGAFDLTSILRPALFVPETKTVRDALREMVQRKVHIAMVADEYGGTAGLVTLEDIVEQVFGEIQDEYELPGDDPPRIEVTPLPGGGGSADADARSYIDDVNSALEPLGVALPEGDAYDTLGGFVLSAMGRIPASGESFERDRVRFTVLEASPMRVIRVRLEVRPGSTADEAASPPPVEPAATVAVDRPK